MKFIQRRPLILAVLLIVVVGGYLFIKNRSDNTDQNLSANLINNVSISIPEGWQAGELSSDDKVVGILLRLTKKDTKDSFILRTTVAELKDDFKLADLPDEVAKTFEKEIVGFKLTDQSTFEKDKLDVVQIRYDQVNAGDKKTYNNEVSIIPTQRQTFYLTFRNEASHQDAVKDDINAISDAVYEYINSHL